MKRLFFIFPVLLIIFLVFKNWFLSKQIIGGDWPFFFNETLNGFSFFPPAWSVNHGGGMGGVIPNYLLDTYLYFTTFIFFNVLRVPWVVVYKVFWFGAFIFFSVLSITHLITLIFQKPKIWQLVIGILLYCSNTYILMVVGGGQMGIALAYSISPLVLGSFIKLLNLVYLTENEFSVKNSQLLKSSLISGLLLAVLILFDPRFGYLVIIAAGIYTMFIFNDVNKKKDIINKVLCIMFFVFGIPFGIVGFIHAQWILPTIVFHASPVPQGILSGVGFRFFSFADFSHAFSFLHPNWPENIFGKTYFLKPEFLLLPILAYSSLLFLSLKQKNQNRKPQYQSQIIFFAFLGLLGTFFAKGVNPPLGEINYWIFQYIPGMNLFRDPTKFYFFIAISFAVLIPFTIFEIQKTLYIKFSSFSQKHWSILTNAVFIMVIVYLLFLIRPAIMGQLGGTFIAHTIPNEYLEVKNFFNRQPEFYRTLWVPKQSRFSFVSINHPAVEAGPLFNATNSASLIDYFNNPNTSKYLSALSIKYVVIPYDSLGEIFLDDRKYNKKERIDLEKSLDTISWLKKIKSGKIVIYQTLSYADHFTLNFKGKISYQAINSSEYNIFVSVNKKSTLVFSDNFSPYWIARANNLTIYSKKTTSGLNSFSIPAGKYVLKVSYIPDKYYFYGRIISILSLSMVFLLIFMLKSKNYEK